MEHDLKTNNAILSAHNWRKKYIKLILDLKPQSKNLRFKYKIASQQLIIEKMKLLGFEPIKSKVAVEITALTGGRNIPQIHNFMKHIIDILHDRNLLENVKDEVFLPIFNDSQIQYLYSRYQFVKGPSSITIKIRPFSGFLSDIRFYEKHFSEKNQKSYYHFNENVISEHLKIASAAEKYIKILGQDGYKSLLNMSLHKRQVFQSSLISFDTWFLKQLFPQKSNLEHLFDLSKWLLSRPIRISIPQIPNEKGAKKQFSDAIEKELIDFRERYPIFENIVGPMIANAVYSAPKTKNFMKDIDNIMRDYVVPAFNRVFAPPTTPMNIHLKPRNVDALSYIPKNLDKSVIGYEIVDISGARKNNKEGFLNIGFRVIDYQEVSLFERLDQYIDTFL